MFESKPLRSFGRRQGRKLRSGKQGLMDELLPKLGIRDWGLGIGEGYPLPNPQSLMPNPLWLEIGFGGGEHLAHQAQLSPDTGIIGCEPYINGIGDLLKHINERGMRNIRIYNDDARDLIAALPDASIEKVFILYPDPWPKTRHHKRRLISNAFLDSLARIMTPGAELRLATDHSDYCTWMLEHLLVHPSFAWQAKSCEDWQKPWQDWIPTRYEQKGLAGMPTYLTFLHI